MSEAWQSGERNYLENAKQKLVQVAGVNVKLSQLNLGGIPSFNASVLTAHLGFPLWGSESLQDPHCRTPAVLPSGSAHRHSGGLPFVILLPTMAGRLQGKQLSFFHPAPLPLLLDVLDTCQPVTNCPQEIFASCFFCLDLQRPRFSWIKYELFSWSHEGRKPLPELFIAVVAAASGLTDKRTEERGKGSRVQSSGCLQCELCCQEPVLRNSWLCNTLSQAVCN